MLYSDQRKKILALPVIQKRMRGVRENMRMRLRRRQGKTIIVMAHIKIIMKSSVLRYGSIDARSRHPVLFTHYSGSST